MSADQGYELTGGRGRHRRRAAKVLERGAPAAAVVDAIAITSDFDDRGMSTSQIRYGLSIAGPSPSRVGVNALLDPMDHVRLGQPVAVRRLDGHVVLDPEPSPGLRAWFQSTCGAPEPGIEDAEMIWSGILRKRGEPATITILDGVANATWGGMSPGIDLTVRVEGGGFDTYEAVLSRVVTRPYASHLERVGARLPGWARPGKKHPAVIDWAAAAVAEPGIGEPPGPLHALLAIVDPGPSIAAATPEQVAATTGGGVVAAAAAHPPIDGVTFEAFAATMAEISLDRVRGGGQDEVAQRHGIPLGTWPATRDAWQQRVAQDWQLGVALREVSQQEQRRRKGS